jgi:folate-binding protein YgfZ
MLLNLDDWLVIRVSGPDATEFLQGVGTQDIAKLTVGVGFPTLFLTDKGRAVALAWVSREEAEGSLLLFVEPGGASEILPHLERLRVMEDVAFTGPGGMPVIVGIGNADNDGDILRRAEQLPGARIVRAAPLSFVLLELGSDRREAARTLGAFAAPDTAEAWRISVGIPRAGVDFAMDRIATELSLEEAISPTKGCYVGQEIVARTTHRGGVRRRRSGFIYPGASGVLAPGTELKAGGSTAGYLTSSTLEPGTGRGLGMGYLTTEALQNPAEVFAIHESTTTHLEVTPWPL